MEVYNIISAVDRIDASGHTILSLLLVTTLLVDRVDASVQNRIDATGHTILSLLLVTRSFHLDHRFPAHGFTPIESNSALK